MLLKISKSQEHQGSDLQERLLASNDIVEQTLGQYDIIYMLRGRCERD